MYSGSRISKLCLVEAPAAGLAAQKRAQKRREGMAKVVDERKDWDITTVLPSLLMIGVSLRPIDVVVGCKLRLGQNCREYQSGAEWWSVPDKKSR